MNVVVVARSPVPGRCKTRLEPLLGPEGCARLQEALIEATLAAVPEGTQVAIADGEIDGVTGFAQEGAHLGERLQHALDVVGYPACVVGTDLPSLRPDDFARAEAALAGADVVLAPASDGGWWLGAFAARAPQVLAIDPDLWGGEQVLDACLAAAREAGLRVALLDERDDLDTPDDAARIARDPATAPAVARLLLDAGA